jgi:hypothetical protein
MNLHSLFLTSKKSKIVLITYGLLLLTGTPVAFSAFTPTNKLEAGENIKCVATAEARNPKKIKFERTEINKSKQANFECPNKICKAAFHPDPGEVTIQYDSLKEIPERICCTQIGKNGCVGKEKYKQVAEKPMEFVKEKPEQKEEEIDPKDPFGLGLNNTDLNPTLPKTNLKDLLNKDSANTGSGMSDRLKHYFC